MDRHKPHLRAAEPVSALVPMGWVVERDQAGVTVEDFLVSSLGAVDRRRLRQACAVGAIRVNRAPAFPQLALAPGDLVEATEPLAAALTSALQPLDEADIPLPVLYEDGDLLVVHKPARMHTVPDRAGKYRGVHGQLQTLRAADDLRIVHRLDYGTSGCLILAKGLEAARLLDRAFREAAIRKEYLALVLGSVSAARDLNSALGPDPRRPGLVRVVAVEARGARAAHTRIEPVEAFAGYTLVRALPTTGRSHQIRVHLASAGHGVVADADYGSGAGLRLSDFKPGYKRRPGVAETPLLDRMFLHAAAVVLPALGSRSVPVRVEAPLPADLVKVLEKLRRFAPSRGV